MKKILLTTIIFLCMGSVVMAQQGEPAKIKTQQKSGLQKRADYNAKVLAAKKSKKEKNESGFVAPASFLNRNLVMDDAKSPNTAN